MAKAPKSNLPTQIELVEIVRFADIQGIEMGVFSDGSAFLTGRALARLCGVAPSVVSEWANSFDPDSAKRRDRVISNLLTEAGYVGPPFHARVDNGRAVSAFPEQVCMAVLEWYAFEAAEVDRRPEALRNFRVLARAGLRAFVYSTLGYDPSGVDSVFASYHQRLLLNPMPSGYWSVFSETAHVVLNAIRHGLIVDSHTVPDISVGQLWSKYWVDSGMDYHFDHKRRLYDHVYPPDYPQAASDRQAWMYPADALGRFRAWLDEVYLPEKYPEYIKRKVKSGALPASRAELLLAATIPQLPEE